MVIGCWSCSVGGKKKSIKFCFDFVDNSIRCYHMKGGDRLDILSIEFVGAENGFLVPVGPVHPILKCGDGERMSEGVGGVEDHIASRPIVIT